MVTIGYNPHRFAHTNTLSAESSDRQEARFGHGARHRSWLSTPRHGAHLSCCWFALLRYCFAHELDPRRLPRERAALQGLQRAHRREYHRHVDGATRHDQLGLAIVAGEARRACRCRLRLDQLVNVVDVVPAEVGARGEGEPKQTKIRGALPRARSLSRRARPDPSPVDGVLLKLDARPVGRSSPGDGESAPRRR